MLGFLPGAVAQQAYYERREFSYPLAMSLSNGPSQLTPEMILPRRYASNGANHALKSLDLTGHQIGHRRHIRGFD